MKQILLVTLILSTSLSFAKKPTRPNTPVAGEIKPASSENDETAFVASVKKAFDKIEELDETPGISHVSNLSKLPSQVQQAVKSFSDGTAFTWKFKGRNLFIVTSYSPKVAVQIFDEKGNKIAAGADNDKHKFVWD
jgi:hypothetical protein